MISHFKYVFTFNLIFFWKCNMILKGQLPNLSVRSEKKNIAPPLAGFTDLIMDLLHGLWFEHLCCQSLSPSPPPEVM